MKDAPKWLANFQENFSAVLRTPLQFEMGRVASAKFPSAADLGVLPRSQRAAVAGLSDYHRQYWFRLLTVLQNDFPLTVHVMGLREFNQAAQAYLLEIPPRAYDLAQVRGRFVDFLGDTEAPELIQQAARLDDIRAEVFMAPPYRLWQARATYDPLSLKLQAAPDWSIFREHWELMELCLSLSLRQEDKPCPEPPRRTQTWLIQRDERGLVHRPLPALQGKLYELLTRNGIQDALMKLEQICPAEDLNELPMMVQQWMAVSVNWGLWAEAD